MKTYIVQYEWWNAPNWLTGELRIRGTGEESLLAEALKDGMDNHKRFRKVRLLEETAVQREIRG